MPCVDLRAAALALSAGLAGCVTMTAVAPALQPVVPQEQNLRFDLSGVALLCVRRGAAAAETLSLTVEGGQTQPQFHAEGLHGDLIPKIALRDIDRCVLDLPRLVDGTDVPDLV